MKKTIHRYVFHIGKWTFVCGRWLFFSALLFSILLSILLIAVKVWLPDIAEKKTEIEQFVSEQTGLVVSTSKIKAYWDGIYPGLVLKNVSLVNPEDKTKTLDFSEIRASLAILPFLRGSAEFSQVIIIARKIYVEKNKTGKLAFNKWILPESSSKNSEQGFFEWLARLHHVEIIAKKFIWSDKLSGEGSFEVQNLEVRLKNNGNQHKLEVTGDFPASLCRSCTLNSTFTSEALTLVELTGSLGIDAIDLDLENLPLTIRKYLPENLSGRFQSQVNAEFIKGNLVSLMGRVIADDLSIPFKQDKDIKVNTISGDVNWKFSDQDWRLLVTDLSMGLISEEWDAGKFRFEKIGRKKLVYLEKARLNDLSDFISKIDTDVQEVEFIKKLNAGGEVRNLRLEFEDNFSSLANTSVSADLVNLEISQVENYPSAQGISGSINVKGSHGEFEFNSRNSLIHVPQVFRAAIETEQLTGTASWHKRKDAWEINMLDLKINAEDVQAESDFQVILHDDRNRLPTVKVRVDFREGRGYRTPLFYPKNLASPELLAWLDRAIQSGYVNKGYAILEGPLDNFPFKDGSGRFDALVDISDATLDYLPGWAPLEDADALLKFNGGEMVITVESGKINDLDIKSATAYAADLTTDEGSVIQISGTADGPIESAINVLRKTPQGSPNGPWEQWLNPDLHTGGDGTLDIQVSFTPGEDRDPVINGTYHTDRAVVILPWKGIEVERVFGTVGFDELGIRNGQVEGKLFGGPVKLDISRQENSRANNKNQIPLVEVKARGRVESREISNTFADWMLPYISGYSDWDARLAWDDKVYFDLKSDLSNLPVKLPAPFMKPKNSEGSLLFTTAQTSNNSLLLTYDLYDASNGKLLFYKKNGKWDFYGANIGIFDATASAPKKPGVEVHATSKEFDGDTWTGVLKNYLGSGDKSPSYINSIHANFENVDLFNRHFGAMDIILQKRRDSLVGSVDGAYIAGKIQFNSSEDSPDLDFDLSRLFIPKDTFRTSKERANPRGIPSMEIKTGQFRFGDAIFGETIIKGIRESLGYRVTRFVVNSDHYKMIGRGRWYRVGDRDDAELKLTFTSNNLGKALTSMGSPDQIADGKGFIETSLKWPKTKSISLANMDGNAKMQFRRGSFLQVEQGAGRMFGLLDMSSIMRYLRLDLSSIFGKGFVFDSLSAKYNIIDGNARTNDLAIKGPSAGMLITGNIGIDKQDFDMVVAVNPSLTDTLALTVGGLVAPQVGAAILILKNIFNTDVIPSPSIKYSIKGTWENPEVNKLAGDQENAAPEVFDDDSTS